jgi:hypothetical protein
MIDFRKSLWSGKQKEGEGTRIDGVRHSREKYGLRVEDATNGEERFPSRNSCLYCLID